MLKLTNTLTGKKELFKPLKQNETNVYVCGITPYDYAHVGHGRVYVFFDVLVRFLRFNNYQVTYCRNFTDIDDKLIARAQKERGNPLEYGAIAQQYIDAFHTDVTALNCLSPDHEPRVTETIPEIIAFIEQLIEKEKAYVVDGNVYFDISSFNNYAQLSKHNLADLRAGSRVEVEQSKKDPLDFALWKKEKKGTFFKSPWGHGRPGWHIECSAMALQLLGEQIDIHGGGMDLIFPHHDNEIAQSEGLTGKQFAQYWIHNAFVQINKEKMSKSLGNFFTLQDIFKQFDPMIVRFYYLSHHYKSPLDFSFESLQDAQKAYKKLCTFFADKPTGEPITLEHSKSMPLINNMLAFLYDDINTTGFIGALFANFDQLKKDEELFSTSKWLVQNVLGLTLEPITEKEETVTITTEMQELIDQRNEARKNKDWKKADEIRDKLQSMGVDIQDQKTD